MTEQIKLPVIYRTRPGCWILFGFLFFVFPIGFLLDPEMRSRADMPYLLLFLLIIFSIPFLFLFRYLKISENGFVYCRMVFSPSDFVSWGNVQSVELLEGNGGKKYLKILIGEQLMTQNMDTTFFLPNDLRRFLSVLKEKAPGAQLDKTVEAFLLNRPLHNDKDSF